MHSLAADNTGMPITKAKDGEFSRWMLSPLDQKSFQEFVFKAFKNRKRIGYVDRSIDQNLFSFKLKLLIFRRWRQLWMKITTIKQRYRINLFFVVFRPFVLLPNSMSKLIHNSCPCKLLIKKKTSAAYVYCVCVLCFSLLFCSPWYSPLKIILRQLFASGSVNIGEYSSPPRLGEYSPMFTSPSPNNC